MLNAILYFFMVYWIIMSIVSTLSWRRARKFITNLKGKPIEEIDLQLATTDQITKEIASRQIPVVIIFHELPMFEGDKGKINIITAGANLPVSLAAVATTHQLMMQQLAESLKEQQPPDEESI